MGPKEEAAISILDDVIETLVRVKDGLEPLEEAIRKAAKARENIVLEAYDLKAIESAAPAPAGLSEVDRRRYHLIRSLAQTYLGLVVDAGASDAFVGQSKLLRAAVYELQAFDEQGAKDAQASPEKPAR